MPVPYSQWSPTAHDARGLGLDDKQDWLVVGVMRTRDSGPLDESNFTAVLKALGGESDTVEVHRFGHWGPGWFEIVLVHPQHADAATKLEDALAYYPVLDENDLYEREHEAAWEAWEAWGRYDYLRQIRTEYGLSDVAFDALHDHVDASALLSACEARESAHFDGDSCVFPDHLPSRDTVAAWLWDARPAIRAERQSARAARAIMASLAR